jgi:hypothetical protein
VLETTITLQVPQTLINICVTGIDKEKAPSINIQQIFFRIVLWCNKKKKMMKKAPFSFYLDVTQVPNGIGFLQTLSYYRSAFH